MGKHTVLVVAIVGVLAVSFLCAQKANAEIYFSDGATHNIDFTIGDRVVVRNSDSGVPTTVNLLNGANILGSRLAALEDSRVNVYGGWVSRIAAGDSSQVTMSGGTVGDYLAASGNGQITMMGGSVGGDLQAWGWDNSQVTMLGGSVSGALQAFDGGHMTIVGSDFAVDGSPVGFGQYFASDFVGGCGILTGTLASGALLNNSFYISTDALITLAPESIPVPVPGAALLGVLGLSYAGCLLRRQRTS